MERSLQLALTIIKKYAKVFDQDVRLLVRLAWRASGPLLSPHKSALVKSPPIPSDDRKSGGGVSNSEKLPVGF
jgi:hypothetical protein